MCAFVATNKAPGVYIDEVQVPGPIPGVGTSTAAFVGPAVSGEIGTPIRLANWTQFREQFGGGASASPYITQPPVYVTHAVQGFFAEGGSDCWFVRVATAKRASLTLQDANGNDTLVVTAKKEGAAANGTAVSAQAASIVSPARSVTRAEGKITAAVNNEVTLANAADGSKFLQGDKVLVDDGAGTTEEATVDSVQGATVNLTTPLQNNFGGGSVRIADLSPGDKEFRLDDASGLSRVQIRRAGHFALVDRAELDRCGRDRPIDGPCRCRRMGRDLARERFARTLRGASRSLADGLGRFDPRRVGRRRPLSTSRTARRQLHRLDDPSRSTDLGRANAHPSRDPAAAASGTAGCSAT